MTAVSRKPGTQRPLQMFDAFVESGERRPHEQGTAMRNT